ncbi:MAG: adenylyl-sulfate kinase [Luteibaculum sp.]
MLDLLKRIDKDPSVKRHLAKTITWRLLGTMDTIILSWIITGSALTGMTIGGVEVVTKMVLYFVHERFWYKMDFGTNRNRKYEAAPVIKNIHEQKFEIDKKQREKLMGHPGLVLWFTGLSGSGKSTLANAVAAELHKKGIHTMSLDGDNTRLGINRDLDFSEQGRKENIRRVTEVAKLMADSGLVTLTSFISPYEQDRYQAKKTIGEDRFVEIFVNTPVEVCAERDVKGLYKKAFAGEIKNFTGVSSPYEAPVNPDLEIKTQEENLEQSTQRVLEFLINKKELNLG